MMQQLLLPIHYNCSDQSFIRSETNTQALSWVMRWPDWPIRFSMIYGPKGCGKTHLARLFCAKSKGLYFDAKHNLSFPMPSSLIVNHIVVDNADFAPEEWLFHLYNHLFFSKGTLLLLSDVSPFLWDLHLNDLKSRLTTFYTIKIEDPDEDILKALIKHLLKQRGIILEDHLCDYILRRIERRYETLHTLVLLIDEEVSKRNKPISLGLVKEVFELITFSHSELI
jgi:chromosomal replication initiation ATPase DnaA